LDGQSWINGAPDGLLVLIADRSRSIVLIAGPFNLRLAPLRSLELLRAIAALHE
jgi:hypothetical protein